MPTGKKQAATATQIMRYGHIAAAIREGMKRNGWTPADFGRAMGYDKNPIASVSTWIAGKSAPTGERRTKLAALLHMSEADLAPRDPHDTPPLDMPPPNRDFSVNRAGRPPSGKKALVFEINTDGTAKIALDLQTSQAKALKILDMLLKAGIDPAADAAEDDA